MGRLTSQRVVAFLSVATQCAALAFMSKLWFFSLLIVVVTLVGVRGRYRIAMDGWMSRVLVYFLALGFIIKALTHDPEGHLGVMDGVFFPYAWGYAGAQFLLILQTAQFFRKFKGDHFPPFIPMLGIAVLALAGKKFSSPGDAFGFRVISSLYAFLLAYSLSLPRPGRRSARARRWRKGRLAISLCTGFLACALGWAAASGFIQIERKLLDVLENIRFPSRHNKASPGFSDQRTSLGSITFWKGGEASEKMILRIFSSEEPGYLRARAYSHYATRSREYMGRRASWADESEKFSLPPIPNPLGNFPPPALEESLFDLRLAGELTFEELEENYDDEALLEDEDEEAAYWGLTAEDLDVPGWRVMDVRPTRQVQNTVFTPVNARLVGAGAQELAVFDNGVVETIGDEPGARYRLFAPLGAEPGGDWFPEALSDKDRERYLSIPSEYVVDQEVRQLASNLFEGVDRASEKMKIVENYFLENYEFKMGIDIPYRTEPLRYFLLEHPAAHCEYFASGAALLLRLGGVPSRYVTGFVASEYNEFGQYWVARNRDAHAWVEAYDDLRGWVVVEATPAAGVPIASGVVRKGFVAQMWDSFLFALMRLKTGIQEGGVQWVLIIFYDWLKGKLAAVLALPGIEVFLGLLAALAVIVLLLLRKRRLLRERLGDPHLISALGLLKIMDGKMARQGMMREDSETLHQFAERIAADEELGDSENWQAAASWYDHYAQIRYGGGLCQEAVERLKGRMKVEG